VATTARGITPFGAERLVIGPEKRKAAGTVPTALPT